MQYPYTIFRAKTHQADVALDSAGNWFVPVPMYMVLLAHVGIFFCLAGALPKLCSAQRKMQHILDIPPVVKLLTAFPSRPHPS